MKKIVIAVILTTVLTGCNSSFNTISRDLPLTSNIVPTPTLCKKAKLSDDVRIVALSNKYCANENITKLRDASTNYEKLRTCYKLGTC